MKILAFNIIAVLFFVAATSAPAPKPVETTKPVPAETIPPIDDDLKDLSHLVKKAK